ncbi:MAG: histidinol-phosphate transaminase [Firmicutes bacterium]|nr:histidinol-phosphate transaminase [Bacillota bacterium]
MSAYLSKRYEGLTPYTPGEQPQDQQYVKLNTNESPFPPSPLAQRLARQAAGDLQLYSDPECRKLIPIAAEALGVKEDQILFSNGSDEMLGYAFMAFCDEDTPAVFPDISYGFYTVFADINRVPQRQIPLTEDFRIDPKDYFGAGGTVVIANPNAPTGLALSLEEIESIVKENPDNVVIIDEAYVDFGCESAVRLIDKYENLLVIQTCSKSRSLAGGRLGFAMGNAGLIRDLDTIKYSLNPYNVNSMTMAAGIGAFLDREYFDMCREKIMETRAYAKKALEDLGFECLDSKSNFLFVRHPAVNAEFIYMRCKDRGVLIRHFTLPRIRDFNRITIGTKEQMDILFETLKTVMEERRDEER